MSMHLFRKAPTDFLVLPVNVAIFRVWRRIYMVRTNSPPYAISHEAHILTVNLRNLPYRQYFWELCYTSLHDTFAHRYMAIVFFVYEL